MTLMSTERVIRCLFIALHNSCFITRSTSRTLSRSTSRTLLLRLLLGLEFVLRLLRFTPLYSCMAHHICQAICPCDNNHEGPDGGYIKDDWILAKFILKMHPESTSINVMDCCHSGSIMDLPYQFKLIPTTGCVKAGKIQTIPV